MKMEQSLINYIEKYSGSSINPDEIELIKNAFRPKKLREKQFFLQEGETLKSAAFITNGAMRQYCIDDKGNEKTVHFYIENYWAADRESLNSLEPSIYNIEAWEETHMLLITPKDFFELTTKIPALAQMHRVMEQRHAVASLRRLNSMLVGSAEMRYSEFVINYPEFVQRFPQHHIASYLGITKETLSRVRRQSMR